jgi:hypothetical protein
MVDLTFLQDVLPEKHFSLEEDDYLIHTSAYCEF